MQLEARILVEKIKTIETHMAAVEKTIEDICTGFEEYHYLLSIPGFGPYVSAVVLAAIATAQRFDNTRQVIKFAGYDLNAQRSGKRSKDAVPVISKKGNAGLRYALYQAALVASSLNAQFRAYYHHLLQGRQREKGILTKMRVKLAAKLLVIAWTLMKKKQAYDPSYLKVQ